MIRRFAGVKMKPSTIDGHRFISAGEAARYTALKEQLQLSGSTWLDVQADGPLLVCKYLVNRRTVTETFRLSAGGRNKYGAKKTTTSDGIVHDSKHEACRWDQLRLLQRAGEIHDLRRQVRYDLVVNDIKIGRYTADHVYWDNNEDCEVVEDAKSEATRKARDYPLRKKLMLACHGITVREV